MFYFFFDKKKIKHNYSSPLSLLGKVKWWPVGVGSGRCGAYRGRCWGMWNKLNHCPQVYPLWCPQERPLAVSRPPPLLSLGSHLYWRGMETLHIGVRHLKSWKENCNSICQKFSTGSQAELTWWFRRFGRRSLPPCSWILNRDNTNNR